MSGREKRTTTGCRETAKSILSLFLHVCERQTMVSGASLNPLLGDHNDDKEVRRVAARRQGTRGSGCRAKCYLSREQVVNDGLFAGPDLVGQGAVEDNR